MPYTTISTGAINASWANANVRDQVVTPFASVAARNAAITAPVTGMLAVTTDTGAVWLRTASAWVQVTGTTTPKYRLRRVANQAIASGEATILWDTTDTNTSSFTVSGGGVITIPTGMAGVYAISGRLLASAGFSGNSYVVLQAAGVNYTTYITTGNSNAAFNATVYLGDGATLFVNGYNPSTSLNFTGNLEMTRVGL